jgi:hypothetical protein
MVRSIREMRQSTRKSVRQTARVRARRKIRESIMICVSGIVKAPLLNSLATEAKLVQVTGTATKHAHKSFISRLRGFFPHFSLWVKGWLWIGWVVSFGWFECFLLILVVGVRNKVRSTLLIIFLHLSNPTPNMYVDLVALSSTQLKSPSIIFHLK